MQKQEEEKKQCEKNIDDLQEKNESLKNDLTKAEKERKELSHKVGAYDQGGMRGWAGGWVGKVQRGEWEVCRGRCLDDKKSVNRRDKATTCCNNFSFAIGTLTGILLLTTIFFLTPTQLSSLELICRQNEDVIKKREEAVKELQSELDRQAQIAAMIHNLSSGKVPISGYRGNPS